MELSNKRYFPRPPAFKSFHNIPIIEDYLSLKKEGNSAIFDNRVTIENIIISEMSQSQKDKYCNDYIYMRYLK